MDMMTTTNTNTNATVSGVTRVETEMPPRGIVAASLPYTNGVLKRHKQQEVVMYGGVTYKECLKNHAATMGGHALDGCGEFMPAQTATATDPRTLKCAACGCHRNFHRLERVPALPGGGGVLEYHPQHRHLPLPPPGLGQTQAVAACQVRSPESDNDSPPPISSTYYPGSAPHMLLALSSGGGTTTTAATINEAADVTKTMTSNSIPDQIFGSRKRFRTKFSQEQKDRMHEFAEKVGWKMQKSTSDLINGFCDEIGVHREVFKVWMHNNKNTLGKRSAANYVISANLNHNHNHNHNQDGISVETNTNNNEHVNGNGVGNSNSSSVSHHLTNASSSSS